MNDDMMGQVSQLAAAIGVLKGTGPEGQSLYYNGQLLTDSLKTLASLGILPDDIVLARPLPVRYVHTSESSLKEEGAPC